MIHEPTSIDPSVVMGDGVTVWRFTTICAGTSIGAGSVVGSCVFIGRDCRLGEGVHIQHGAFIPNGTVIGDRVFIGPNAVLTDDKRPRAGAGYSPAPPILEELSSIGAGAAILPGVTIGKGALVAAGSVITRSVPPAALAISRGQAARNESEAA